MITKERLEELIENEVWKVIDGSNGDYLVSSYGRVKGVRRELNCVSKRGKNYVRIESERILELQKNKDGYLCVRLTLNNMRTSTTVHRLVATHFIENPLLKETVNHIDGNKENNKVDNLEWCSRSENTIHAIKTGLKNYDSYCKKVYILNLDTNETQEFKSRTDAGLYVGVPETQISKSCYHKVIMGKKTKQRFLAFDSLEDLNEYAEFGNITRTERLEFPSWENIESIIEQKKRFGLNHSDRVLARIITKDSIYYFKLCKDLDLFTFQLKQTYIGEDLCEELTSKFPISLGKVNKTNYDKARRLCVKLFKGEEV